MNTINQKSLSKNMFKEYEKKIKILEKDYENGKFSDE